MTVPIDFSPEALEAFWARCMKRDPLPRAVRLGVRGGACSGLQYVIEFDDGPIHMGDTEWSPDGWGSVVSFRVDKKSILFLSGSRVTWHKSLMKEGFEFENPQEASRCGCGHSFAVK